MPIPAYLKEIAVPVSEKGEWTTFSLKCTCGCEAFFLSENRFTKEEEKLYKPYMDELIKVTTGNPFGRMDYWVDEEGYGHSWRLLSEDPNGPREIITYPIAPVFASVSRLTIACAACGAETLLFDDRHHGYDGITGKHTAEELAYQPHMKQRRGGPIAIQVKVETTETPESFREVDRTDLSPADWTNAFDWIIVYKIKDGKKTKIFEMETA